MSLEKDLQISDTFTLVVLGQTVHVDGLSVIEDEAQPGSMTLSALVVGDMVEISGLPDASGTLVVTRIERHASFIGGVTEVEVKGIISRLDGNARSFALGHLRVDFSSATIIGVLGNEVTVEVRGRRITPVGVLIATLDCTGNRSADRYDDRAHRYPRHARAPHTERGARCGAWC